MDRPLARPDAPDLWSRIEPLLDELLDLDDAARRERLDDLTGADIELRAELERLLAADREASRGVLDRGVEDLAAAILEHAEPPPPSVPLGTRIGPYRVIGELGRGGMGEVLLAERATGDFEQRVAIKIMREDVDRAEAVNRRFRRERSILARLRHPNIAVLHDGGTTDDGVPYFVMEYVEGDRITDWCDERRLGIEDRLRLFERVCDAVDSSHRNLVVHRDIKPSNVFVTSDGVVKLLDFGIGKLLDADDPEETQPARRFFTPAYAAPEQIRGETVSTSADVFALGMLLYVLLTGRHPHGDTTRSSALARAILEDDPAPASVAVAQDGPETSCAETAARRGTTPAGLRRRLKGDLDTILAKALRKSPEARYASAREFREDLERFRASLPIAARRPSWRDRAWKFARRHRVGTVAGIGLLLAVLAGIGGILWQSGVTARERDRARAVQEYLIEVFSAVDPNYEEGETLTALQLVERGAARVSDRFRDDPGVRAEISLVLGTVLTSLAQYDRAEEVLSIAAQEYERLGDRDGRYETLLRLADTAQGRGDPETALVRSEDATEFAAEAFGPDDPRALSATISEVNALVGLGRTEDARALARRNLEQARRVHGERTEGIAPFHQALANVAAQDGSFEDGAHHARRAAEAYQAAGVGGARLSAAYTSLGDMLGHLDRKEESEAVLRRAVDVLREEYGPDGHPALASAMHNLAGPLMQSSLAETAAEDRLAEAESMLRESLVMFAAHLGDLHWRVGQAYSSLSVVKTKQGDIEAAGDLLRESIRITRAAVGDRHPAIAAPLSNLARNLLRQKRYDEAADMYDEAIAIARECFGDHHQYVSHPLAGYGDLCTETGRLDEAERAIREAWTIRRDTFGAQHSLVVETRVQLAGVLEKAGRDAEAVAQLDGALDDARGGLPDTRTVLASALLARARQGRAARASRDSLRTMLEEAHAIREEEYGPDDARTTDVAAELAALDG